MITGQHGHLGCLMMQVALIEEQTNEAAENEGADKVEDEAKPIDIDPSAAEGTRNGEILDDKPDINDVPVEESQVNFYLFLQSLAVSFHFLLIPERKYCLESNKYSLAQSALGLCN